MSGQPKKRFSVATGMPPSAEDTPGVMTPGRQDVTTSRPAASPAGRIAFTWRLTPAQAFTLDDMTLRLKRQLGRGKLDRSELLAALVGLADDNPAVFGALVARLQADQAS